MRKSYQYGSGKGLSLFATGTWFPLLWGVRESNVFGGAVSRLERALEGKADRTPELPSPLATDPQSPNSMALCLRRRNGRDWYQSCLNHTARPLTTPSMLGEKNSKPEFESSSNLLIPCTLVVVQKKIASSYVVLATRAGLYKKKWRFPILEFTLKSDCLSHTMSSRGPQSYDQLALSLRAAEGSVVGISRRFIRFKSTHKPLKSNFSMM